MITDKEEQGGGGGGGTQPYIPTRYKNRTRTVKKTVKKTPKPLPAWLGSSPNFMNSPTAPPAWLSSPSSGSVISGAGNVNTGTGQATETWKPSDFQTPAWLSQGLKVKDKDQGSSLNTETGTSGNVFNPSTTPVPDSIANANPSMPNVAPAWLNPNGAGLTATPNPTSLATATGVYGIAPWLIPGPTQNQPSNPSYGFGTQYGGWGGEGGGGSRSYDNGGGYLPPWYMNLYGWNFKG